MLTEEALPLSNPCRRCASQSAADRCNQVSSNAKSLQSLSYVDVAEKFHLLRACKSLPFGVCAAIVRPYQVQGFDIAMLYTKLFMVLGLLFWVLPAH